MTGSIRGHSWAFCIITKILISHRKEGFWHQNCNRDALNPWDDGPLNLRCGQGSFYFATIAIFLRPDTERTWQEITIDDVSNTQVTIENLRPETFYDVLVLARYNDTVME